jgi:hypothetical protein
MEGEGAWDGMGLLDLLGAGFFLNSRGGGRGFVPSDARGTLRGRECGVGLGACAPAFSGWSGLHFKPREKEDFEF